MSAISFDRLRRMTRQEVAWRTRQAGRTAAQRLALFVRPMRWDRTELQGALAEGVLDGALLSPGPEPPWDEIHAELARAIRRRSSRFVLDPASKPQLTADIVARWPAAPEEAQARAERILAGCYDLLGYRGLPCGAPDGCVEWHRDPVHGCGAPLHFWADVAYLDPAIGDHKVIWELNRHQHWMQLGRALWLTGDPRFRRAILQQLQGWLAANPPFVGINWASMLEVGLRSLSWLWALHFLLPDGERSDGGPEAPWLVDMCLALDRQLTHVEHNLSVYFSPNTHLTGEALALYVAGVALPELAASHRWADTGRRILLEEIDRQIHLDGGHAERSMHYQRYTLDFYLLAYLTAERDRDEEAASAFAAASRRLAEFTRTIADDEGRLPLIGDDDGGMLWPITGRACRDVRDSLALAAVVLDRPDFAPWGIQEQALWIAGCRAAAAPPPGRDAAPPCIDTSDVRHTTGAASRALADTGYFVARDARGDHAVFDVGLHGYQNGGHAHADALALTLTLAGRPFLIDPGTSTYTIDRRLRDQLRSSMSHNTVTIGDRSQAIPAGPFHWRTHADARLHAWAHSAGFDWAEAFHDAYAPVRHRRSILRTAGDGWLIADEILGDAAVTASAHWHFDPAWTLRCDTAGRLHARHADGHTVWLLHNGGDVLLAHGDEESGLGWYAPVYGTLLPTWSARVTRHGHGPYTILTWIGEAAAAPLLEAMEPAGENRGAAVAVRIGCGGRATVFLLRPGEPALGDTRACGVPDYQTNARVLHYTCEHGRLATLDLVDASDALALRDGWISVAASEPMRDLHATLADGLLELFASEPPPQLRLQGGAIRELHRIRLNRREIPRPRSDRPDTLVIYGVDWPTTSHLLAAVGC